MYIPELYRIYIRIRIFFLIIICWFSTIFLSNYKLNLSILSLPFFIYIYIYTTGLQLVSIMSPTRGRYYTPEIHSNQEPPWWNGASDWDHHPPRVLIIAFPVLSTAKYENILSMSAVLTSSSWLCTCCTIRSMATMLPPPTGNKHRNQNQHY